MKLSADGVAFLLHDATLERTTNGHGRADARTWRELSQLDAGSWHSSSYAGEPLPTLGAVARWSLAHDVAVNIEIKSTRGRERETGAAVALDAAALWAEARLPPLLSSFSDAALEAARDAVRALPRAWLADRLPDDWQVRAARAECVAVDLEHTLLNRAHVEEFHAAGLHVLAWTVNDPVLVERLFDLGADTVITDAVDILAFR